MICLGISLCSHIWHGRSTASRAAATWPPHFWFALLPAVQRSLEATSKLFDMRSHLYMFGVKSGRGLCSGSSQTSDGRQRTASDLRSRKSGPFVCDLKYKKTLKCSLVHSVFTLQSAFADKRLHKNNTCGAFEAQRKISVMASCGRGMELESQIDDRDAR